MRLTRSLHAWRKFDRIRRGGVACVGTCAFSYSSSPHVRKRERDRTCASARAAAYVDRLCRFVGLTPSWCGLNWTKISKGGLYIDPIAHYSSPKLQTRDPLPLFLSIFTTGIYSFPAIKSLSFLYKIFGTIFWT